MRVDKFVLGKMEEDGIDICVNSMAPMFRKCDEEDINDDDDSGFNNNSNYLLIIRR